MIGLSQLLFNEPPLVISPSLARVVGLNGAIVLQQIHYWLQKSGHMRNGVRWIYNTYKDWQEQFPFWSEKTIKRVIKGLKETGLIEIGNFNKLKIDKTNWYTINYEKVEEKTMAVSRPLGQNGPSIGTNCPVEEDNLTLPLPETTHKNNTDINIPDAAEFKIWWEEYPAKRGKAKAREAWMKLRKEGKTAAELTLYRDRYIKEIETEGVEEKYVMHGNTFLNGRWEDYAKEPVKGAKKLRPPKGFTYV